jgi:hypothetical protein
MLESANAMRRHLREYAGSTTLPVLEGELGLGWGVGGVYAVEEAAD